jgi:hypothetical protein
MRRREWLGGSALAGAGALGLGSSGCAPAWPEALEPGVMPADMDAFLATVDARMQDMTQARFVEGFAESVRAAPLRAEHRSELQRRDKVFQRMLRTLYLTQTFRDLPEEAQRHPGMQSRMFGHLDEIDGSVEEVTELLKSSSGDHEALRAALKQHPDLGMQIGEAIDQRAARAGISVKRRVQLRGMMKQASFRLKNAPAHLVIDEYVQKAERMGKSNPAPSSLGLAAQAGSEAFWALQSASAAPPPPAPASTTPRAGVGTMRVGGIMMGIGLVVGAASLAIVSSGGGGAIYGVTLGAVLLAIGFIVLIVGGLTYLASSD